MLVCNGVAYIMNSSFVQTPEATPPIINQGLITVCPPLQLVPASLHKSIAIETSIVGQFHLKTLIQRNSNEYSSDNNL